MKLKQEKMPAKSNPFQKVRVPKPKRSLFDLSHERKMSIKFSKIYPMLLEEIVPGDQFQVTSEVFARLAPLIAPVMHRINIFIHYFFVPHRLVWENWETFITGDFDGLDSSEVPYTVLDNSSKSVFAEHSLADYFGFSVDQSPTYTNQVNINFLPFRGYGLIWDEYYRDQALDSAKTVSKGDTVTTGERNTFSNPFERRWEKDYFTSASTQAQRGASQAIPVTLEYDKPPVVRKADDDTVIANMTGFQTDASGNLHDNAPNEAYIDVFGGDGELDVTISDLRRSTAIQRWLERNARAGSRYVEQLLSHFGVRSKDQRLQRPEYLGGGVMPITVSEVLNTSATATEPQGNMAGHGLGMSSNQGFKRYFTEHGYIHGLVSVLPRTCYQQGIPKHFLKNDKYDFYWPEFAHIGEQAIDDRELYLDTNLATSTFGYQQRYAEYKYRQDSVHGDFRSTLDHWHAGRIFDAKPVLNANFVKAETDPTDRLFAVVSSTDDIYLQIYNNVRAIRPIPYYSDPRL